MAQVWVFAVEDTSAQVCWRGLPAGATISLGDSSVEVTAGGSAGAASFRDLPPATRLDLLVRRPGGGEARVAETVRTLDPPPGELVCRFATVNDLHIGERRFGLVRHLRDDPWSGLEPYPLRCARAALTEARAWGAEAIVAKGDLTYKGRPQQWADVGRLLSGVGLPVAAVLGNHDVGTRAVDGRDALAASGITIPHDPFVLELPGISVVLAHTTVAHKGHGAMPGPQRDRVAELVAAAPGPAFVALHHYPQRFRRPTTYPPGIPGDQARALLDTIAEANPASFVSTGHSHRNRRRYHRSLVVTQIGATMHYPGTWAGYAVHEGGIRQVVRRVAAPEAIEWTDRTRRAVLGVWGLVAPGLRSHRCFSHTWPRRSRAGWGGG
ncbi:MAG: metallophosphoesterase family protein [Actinomycetota bacterium]